MSGNSLYWEFDDRNPAFTYGPGWLNLTNVNAYGSTLSYTPNETNVTIRFYGKTIWLFGVIGRTEDWNQPVFRYTLDDRYISTVTAEIKNNTSYNELLAYFYNLDSSNHTLVVENVKEGATLFLDYYLVEPIPPDELTGLMGNLQTGGKPLSTSISENPMLVDTAGLSRKAAAGSFVGAAIGGIFLAFLIAAVAFIFWRRRGGSKPYYYKSAAVHEVLFDELKPRTREWRELPVISTFIPYSPSPPTSYYSPERIQRSPPTRTRTIMSQSSRYSLGSDWTSTFGSPQQTYFPLPSEYQSNNRLAGSRPFAHSRSLSYSQLLPQSPTRTSFYSSSSSSTHSTGPLPREERPFL